MVEKKPINTNSGAAKNTGSGAAKPKAEKDQAANKKNEDAKVIDAKIIDAKADSTKTGSKPAPRKSSKKLGTWLLLLVLAAVIAYGATAWKQGWHQEIIKPLTQYFTAQGDFTAQDKTPESSPSYTTSHKLEAEITALTAQAADFKQKIAALEARLDDMEEATRAAESSPLAPISAAESPALQAKIAQDMNQLEARLNDQQAQLMAQLEALEELEALEIGRSPDPALMLHANSLTQAIIMGRDFAQPLKWLHIMAQD
ncbi:MAG: hypothetical protein AB8B77_05055, partial [Alphaproteobacteria bacterium]